MLRSFREITATDPRTPGVFVLGRINYFFDPPNRRMYLDVDPGPLDAHVARRPDPPSDGQLVTLFIHPQHP